MCPLILIQRSLRTACNNMRLDTSGHGKQTRVSRAVGAGSGSDRLAVWLRPTVSPLPSLKGSLAKWSESSSLTAY